MRFAVLLFVLLLVSCFFATFMPQETADALVYQAGWFRGLLALLFLSILFCVIKRLMCAIRSRSLCGSASSLFFHSGTCIIILGAFCTMLFTQNSILYLHEKESTNIVKDAHKNDFTLPFTLLLERFVVEYQTGTLHYILVKNKEEIQGAYQLALEQSEFTLKTGETVRAVTKLMFEQKKISLFLDDKNLILAEAQTTAIGDGYSLLYITQNISEALSYSSNLTFIDKRGKKNASIDANNPAYFKGYGIYQSGYSEDGAPISVLTVKRDWGKYITLVGSLLLCTGLFLRFFFVKNGLRGISNED